MVIHGLGGMGKTQLAIRYLHQHRADYPDGCQDQFGSNYHRLRDFRRRFSQALATVLKHYEAGIEPRSSGLLLRPSPPSVARRR